MLLYINQISAAWGSTVWYSITELPLKPYISLMGSGMSLTIRLFYLKGFKLGDVGFSSSDLLVLFPKGFDFLLFLLSITSRCTVLVLCIVFRFCPVGLVQSSRRWTEAGAVFLGQSAKWFKFLSTVALLKCLYKPFKLIKLCEVFQMQLLNSVTVSQFIRPIAWMKRVLFILWHSRGQYRTTVFFFPFSKTNMSNTNISKGSYTSPKTYLLVFGSTTQWVQYLVEMICFVVWKVTGLQMWLDLMDKVLRENKDWTLTH